MSEDRLCALLREAATASGSRIDPEAVLNIARRRSARRRMAGAAAAAAVLATAGVGLAGGWSRQAPASLASGDSTPSSMPAREGATSSPAPAAGGTYSLVDQRTLRVEVNLGGVCDPPSSATARVEETSSEVRLSISVFRSSAPPRPATEVCVAIGWEQQVDAALASPLGDRTVVDAATGAALRQAP